MKVTLRNGTVYPYGLALDYKEGGKVGFTYHDKVVSPMRKDESDRFKYILKTIELDAADLASVTDYSHDPK